MRAFGVVILAPGRERGAGVVQGRSQRFVQKLVSQATVEALDEGVLGRIAGRDVVPVDLALVTDNGIAFEVNSVPLSVTTVWGFPRASNRVANFRATLAPDREVSAIRARHSRVLSSTTVSTRKRRPSVSWSDTKSSD